MQSFLTYIVKGFFFLFCQQFGVSRETNPNKEIEGCEIQKSAL